MACDSLHHDTLCHARESLAELEREHHKLLAKLFDTAPELHGEYHKQLHPYLRRMREEDALREMQGTVDDLLRCPK